MIKQRWRIIPWQQEWGIIRGDASVPYVVFPDPKDAELAVSILNIVVSEIL